VDESAVPPERTSFGADKAVTRHRRRHSRPATLKRKRSDKSGYYLLVVCCRADCVAQNEGSYHFAPRARRTRVSMPSSLVHNVHGWPASSTTASGNFMQESSYLAGISCVLPVRLLASLVEVVVACRMRRHFVPWTPYLLCQVAQRTCAACRLPSFFAAAVALSPPSTRIQVFSAL